MQLEPRKSLPRAKHCRMLLQHSARWGLITIVLFLCWLIPTGILVYSFAVKPINQDVGLVCLGISIISFALLSGLVQIHVQN